MNLTNCNVIVSIPAKQELYLLVKQITALPNTESAIMIRMYC
jgi:hypothetical protein